jgi:hypothetical protein
MSGRLGAKDQRALGATNFEGGIVEGSMRGAWLGAIESIHDSRECVVSAILRVEFVEKQRCSSPVNSSQK